MIVTIILGYDIFNKNDHIYKKYLDRSLKLIAETKSQAVIISGGASNKDYLHISEAKSIQEYLLEQNPELRNKIFYEERALTTLQNIMYSKELILQKKIKATNIQIICDSIRLPKVFYLAMMYFNDILNLSITEQVIFKLLLQQQKHKVNVLKEAEFTYKNLSIRGIPFKRDRKYIVTQILSSMVEIGGYHYPELEQEYVNWRKEDFGLE